MRKRVPLDLRGGEPPTPEARPTPQAPRQPPTLAARTPRARSREGMKVLAAYFPPSTAREVRKLAADRDTTVQALLVEAIEDLLSKHRR